MNWWGALAGFVSNLAAQECARSVPVCEIEISACLVVQQSVPVPVKGREEHSVGLSRRVMKRVRGAGNQCSSSSSSRRGV